MMSPEARMTCLTMSAIAALGLGLAMADNAVADLGEGLVAYWSFDDGTAYDNSGNGHHGVIHGASPIKGVSGQALWFDGDDYVEIPDTQDFEFANEPVTFATWVTIMNNVDEYRFFVGLCDIIDGLPDMVIAKSRSGYWDGRIYFQILDAKHQGLTCVSIANGDQLPKHPTWIHVAGVADWGRRSATLYVNGLPQESKAMLEFDLSKSQALGLRIGDNPRQGVCGNHYGAIDEVRVYNRALTHDEILDLYWGTTHPQPPEPYNAGSPPWSGDSGDPVNTATGNFAHEETDLAIASRGRALGFSRAYNSRQAASRRGRQPSSRLASSQRGPEAAAETDDPPRPPKQQSVKGEQEMTVPRTRRSCFTMSAIAALGLGLAMPDRAVADLGEGLVAYWSFDEGEGDTAYDYSGHGNHGSICGASWVNGVSGSALYFDGNGYVQCGSPVQNTPPYTVCAWVKADSACGTPCCYIVTNGGETNACYGFSLQQMWWLTRYDDVWMFAVSLPMEYRLGLAAPPPASTEWTFLCGTWEGPSDPDGPRLYVDGILASLGGPPDQLVGSSPSNLHIGTPSDAPGHYGFHGIIDEVRIYNRALSHDEILDLFWAAPYPQPPEPYNAGSPPWSGDSGDPVNTATGNFAHQETDLAIASRATRLVTSRFYNSLAAGNEATRQQGNKGRQGGEPLGPGWTHSYYIWLDPDAPDEQVGIHWGDGRADYWMDDGQGGYMMSVPGVYDTLVQNPYETWTLTRTNLDVYEFDAGGRLLSITDKNGNTTTLSYTNPTYPDFVTEVTDPVGRTLTLVYDANGLLQSITDWTGRNVQYGYQEHGGQLYLTQVTDVLGRTIDYAYEQYEGNWCLASVTDQRGVTVVTNTCDENGRVLEQLDGNGSLTTFLYDARGPNQTTMVREVTLVGQPDPRVLETTHPHEELYKRQLAHEDPLGEPVEYGYDGMFNRSAISDRNGNTTGFEYDEHGNVTIAAEADDPNDPNDGGITAVAYEHPEFAHLPTQMTDAPGYVTDWTYDADGNVLTEQRWLDLEQTEYAEKSWTYNSFGQRLTETDERGNVHQWHYDANGLLEYEIDREGNYTWYGYDDLWRRIWVTDGRGTGPQDPAYTTYYFYNAANRLIRIEGPPVGDPPHSIVQWFGYDEIGNRTWVTDGNGAFPEDPNHTTRYEYDGNSNLIRVTDPLDGQTQYAYDEINRRVKMADPSGNLETQYTRYEHDDGDRLEQKEDSEGNLRTYTYDAQGNLLTETDPSGVTVTHEYDALNRRVLTHDELSNETHFEYDQLGRLVRQIDAEGNETEFGYDALGRLVCVVDAEDGWTEYTYDVAGNLIEVEDARNAVVSIRAYDANNRLIYAEDGNGNYYMYGYDAVGNQTWVIDANGQAGGDTTHLAYDAENRLIQIDYPDGTWVTYTYDDNGNRLEMTDTNGLSSFTYDPLNRLLTTTDSYGKVVQYGYDAVGNRTKLTYPDDKVVTYGYDTANRLTTITDWAEPARVTEYGYNGMRIDTVAYPSGVVETRGYDDAGRLTSLDTVDSGATPLLSFAWARDGVGNPTSVTETGTLQPTLEQVVTEYEYDTDNRLVESSQGTYEYDANGNLISRAVDGVTTTFAYDAEDRLVSQTTGGSMVEHVYDGDSHRIARVDGAGETRYVLDRGRSMSHVLCETNATGTITAYYVHGPQIVARIDVQARTEAPRYYHTNDIGNVVALTDPNELITDRYGYTPFGLLRAEEGSTDNPFTYVGGLGVMAESDGLYFMRARFYDPDTGRFLGKDPVEGALTDPRGLHRYVYASNKPVVLADPSGLLPPIPDENRIIALGLDGWPQMRSAPPGLEYDIFGHNPPGTATPEVLRELGHRSGPMLPGVVPRAIAQSLKGSLHLNRQYVESKILNVVSYPSRAVVTARIMQPIAENLLGTRYGLPPTPIPEWSSYFECPSWWASDLPWLPRAVRVKIDVSSRCDNVKKPKRRYDPSKLDPSVLDYGLWERWQTGTGYQNR